MLTDRICGKCSKVPLMRSPSNANTYFCVTCDSGPIPAPSPSSLASPGQVSQKQAESETSSSTTSVHSTQQPSRPSTPFTEMSSTLSSPTFAPIDTAEVLRRRQQSDTASAEIGRRLLKGWAMLADECPNSECFGIPLVRPPKSGPEKDPRKVRLIDFFPRLTWSH